MTPQLILEKILLSIAMITLTACSNAEQNSIPVVEKKLNAQHQIKVDGCEISYNNKPIDFNQPLDGWLKVFGNHYRKVDYMDTAYMGAVKVPKEYYIYDDTGIRMVYDLNNKKMEYVGFLLEHSELNHDFKSETAEEYQLRLKDPNSFQAKQDFKDGIQVEDVILGAYPMDRETRQISRNKRSTAYYIWAECKSGQKGESFDVNITTSLNQPEIIDGIDFFVILAQDIPEDVSLRQEYELCDGMAEDDIIYGQRCIRIRKQYQEKFGTSK
ncbi:hypothetical protein EC844_1542 [Acinetobacter calcoaceticus]|uniref:DUF7738 domain-containing protein n=1 Tax=Acinetobacter calcoaceticus TaxID=471 RepID=A0A4R1X631_ACICA|nr:hypothetical protein EC844_1542 [Acinetobacter calcoaceticus]